MMHACCAVLPSYLMHTKEYTAGSFAGRNLKNIIKEVLKHIPIPPPSESHISRKRPSVHVSNLIILLIVMHWCKQKPSNSHMAQCR